jgi:phasin family protein
MLNWLSIETAHLFPFFKEPTMSETTFDPKTIFESYRTALAPTLKAQQEGVKALDRVGRYQHAVAGDYLEWSLAQARAAVAAQTPAEFVAKQIELTTALSERLRARAQEFVRLAADTQTGFSDVVHESVAKNAAETKKKAS